MGVPTYYSENFERSYICRYMVTRAESRSYRLTSGVQIGTPPPERGKSKLTLNRVAI